MCTLGAYLLIWVGTSLKLDVLKSTNEGYEYSYGTLRPK